MADFYVRSIVTFCLSLTVYKLFGILDSNGGQMLAVLGRRPQNVKFCDFFPKRHVYQRNHVV
jgi:hypothetical protein